MMIRKYQHLGDLTVQSQDQTKVHKIEYAPGYGVVCVSLVTSNGSLRMVAAAVEAGLKENPNFPNRRAVLLVEGREVQLGNVTQALVSASNKACVDVGDPIFE